MMIRSATHSPWELEEVGSSSGKGVGEIEAVVEVNPVSRSVAHAEAAAAPSPSHVTTSDFELVDSPSRSYVDQVDSRSRLEVEASSSLHAYLPLLWLAELRCRSRLEL